jgi:hypothetical protein
MTDKQLEYIEEEFKLLDAEMALVNSLLGVSFFIFVFVVALIGIASALVGYKMRQKYLKSRN